MIEVKNLNKEFKTNKKYPGFKGAIKSFFSREYVTKTAVADISFKINDGEIVGYIGSNGAGKSTTIKMMTGILKPTSGSIIVNGYSPYENRQKNAKNIGVVFGQKTQLWWDLPLSETFSLLKNIYNINDKDFNERMSFLNDILDMKPFLLSPVRTLSLGQRMRADLAAAFLHNPKVIYLDEPTIGLDIVVKDNVRKAIKQINKKYGTTIILTTHDLKDIEELCNRIIIIDSGSLIYDGSLDEIKSKYGYTAKLTIQIREKFNLSDVNFIKDLDKDYINLTSCENKLIIEFNKNNVSSSDIIRKLLEKFDVIDFNISEIGIEEIVKKIYRNEV